MTGPGGVERIDAKIEGWRRSLLDLTRRNPLSSFRISDRSRRQLELVEPEAAALFDRLTSPGQRCDIYYREPEPGEQETDAEPVPRLARVGEVRTGRDAAVNWRTLYTIEKKAREFEQEQGVNVLFVACGFLQWPEAQDPEQTRLAPLLLVPVSLTDEPQHSRYSLGMVDDEPLVNPVLVRLLQSDFRLGLPEFALPENGPEGALQAWLEEVDEIAAGREGWSVTRRCFLGLFSFLKLAMYEDLDRCRAEAAAHPLVRALAGDTEALAPLVEAPLALPLPEDLDAQVPPLDCYQILDADASQQVAIEAAKRGQSFILHGPPGTGKSQTIANLIAEFLAAGKTILFVSEKMAALDVVWRHLERHHLADFCLPLHSHQAQKSEVYRLLGRSLEGVRQLAGPDTPDDAALMAMRIRLNEHAKQLNEPVPPLGWTPVRACGEVARLEQAPALAFAFDDADQLDRVRYDDIRQHLAALEPVYQVLLRAKGHPWRGTAADLHVDEATLTARLRALSEGLAAQQDASAALAEACGLDAPGTLAELELLCQRADVLAESPRPPSAWLLDSCRLTMRAWRRR
ncbi:MAG: DUF4011 domain-containing protein [Armatimonadetes bacterium]|nr:DUF4011 domain-containing protein [Armatimonadota bacterium]